MFCYQCEQTAKGTGCTVQGVCGKSPEVAALQDLLLYSLMGLSQVAVEGRKVGISDNDVNVFTVKAAFSTLTNVDFDPDRFMDLIRQSTTLREKLKAQVDSAGGNVEWSDGPAAFQPKNSLDDLVKQNDGSTIMEATSMRESRKTFRSFMTRLTVIFEDPLHISASTSLQDISLFSGNAGI